MITQVRTNPQTPRYRIPRGVAARFLLSFMTRSSRSFARDSQAAVRGLHPPVQVWGADFIPDQGPCLVACNHFSRPGFDAWWLALAISAAVAARRAAQADPEIHWVMTAAWTFPESRLKQRLVTPLTRLAFARVAQVYDFILMPPMPPAPEEMAARAAAVLRTLRLARRLAPAGGMIGLAPEGQDFSARVGQPPQGTGEFISLLVRAGLPVLPVGVGEPGGRLTVAFGEVFTPEIPAAPRRRDKAVADQIMRAIQRVVPTDKKPSTRITHLPL